jgi:hypothetical protein
LRLRTTRLKLSQRARITCVRSALEPSSGAAARQIGGDSFSQLLEQAALPGLLALIAHGVVAPLESDRDLIERETFTGQSDEVGDLFLPPGLHGHRAEVMHEVLGPGHNLEVADVVVQRVVVAMVHNLVGGQCSAEVLLDEETMYGNLPAILPAVQVPLIEIVIGFHAL